MKVKADRDEASPYAAMLAAQVCNIAFPEVHISNIYMFKNILLFISHIIFH